LIQCPPPDKKRGGRGPLEPLDFEDRIRRVAGPARVALYPEPEALLGPLDSERVEGFGRGVGVRALVPVAEYGDIEALPVGVLVAVYVGAGPVVKDGENVLLVRVLLDYGFRFTTFLLPYGSDTILV
jgi:hypothetical protein